MTARAVILGLIIAAGLASVGFVNDVWMQFTCIGSDLLPTYAYGLLLAGLLLVNPMLGLIWRRLEFTPAEFVVMLSLVMMGSVIAGSGLLWTFPHPLIVPIQDQRASPGWEAKDLVGYVPDAMLVEDAYARYARGHGIQRLPTDKNWQAAVARSASPPELARLQEEDDRLIKDFTTGRAPRGQWIDPADVPWGKWAPALSFWLSLLGLNFIAGLAAVVIVHRQWSQREHLGYPMVSFAHELIAPPEQGRLFGPIFRSGKFWWGFGAAFGVLLINGYYAWNPGSVQIELGVSLAPFRELLGAVAKVPWVNILNVSFFFSAVGLAYFLTSEASFSLGISGWLYALAAAPLVAAGVDLSTDVLAGGLPAFMYFGAYVGMGVMVFYLGRRFYWAVIRRTLGLPVRSADVLPREVLAGRILILSNLAMVLLLWWVGLDALVALAVVVLTGLLFLMVGRINVATGLFIIQPFWHPGSILLAMLGAFVLGPKSVVILGLLGVVITLDPRIAALPLALNALKLGDLQGLKPGRLAGWMGAGILLAMVVGVLATVYLFYNFGLTGMDSPDARWSKQVAGLPMNMLERSVNDLDQTDALAACQQPLGIERLAHIQTRPRFWTAAGIGLALVLACSWLRLRFPRWPLHPLLFLVWGSKWTTEFAPSFLLAWVIKETIMRYGGQKGYYRARPVFIGLMAGEFAAGLFWGIVGVSYYAIHHVVGPRFLVRP